MNCLQEITQFLKEREAEAKEYLQRLVNTDSNSFDKAGVNQVGLIIQEILDNYQIPFIVKRNKEFGNHIIATVKGQQPGKIVLMGHQDTVFPKGTANERPYSEDQQFAYGPGVSDMKGSLVSMIMAASAVKTFAMDEMCDIELLFTPEEEIGSPISCTVIEQQTKNALGVFNMEPARPDGSIVTARKGSAHMQVRIEGKAAHSGLAIEEGISAIDELAHKIINIKELMNLEEGITVNVGTVQGGVANNTVAPQAKGTIHTGFWRMKDFEQLKKDVQSIVDNSYVEGTKAVLTLGAGILPMEKNKESQKMYEVVKEAADLVAIPITETATKGAADAGFSSTIGVPTICGMGPVGGKWHSEEEYLVLGSFVPRMQLLAVSMVLYSRSCR
ncbi:M20 family metallopeptidase [Sporosarcina aquimarina]|uniref:M20 family metallopeptidase n=1 Tax=Sporosarcina aquimarina TaxID=114975 RepID=UPI001C8DC572|nr:M20 family metallopeptidase [Sporosarcina aquimarina]MBY0221615.1 M20 family metallopeptidase [Sporosarcina aquimarina]